MQRLSALQQRRLSLLCVGSKKSWRLYAQPQKRLSLLCAGSKKTLMAVCREQRRARGCVPSDYEELEAVCLMTKEEDSFTNTRGIVTLGSGVALDWSGDWQQGILSATKVCRNVLPCQTGSFSITVGRLRWNSIGLRGRSQKQE